MKHDPGQHGRQSTRLPGYDYRQAGAYFLTLVIHRHVCLLGEIAAGEMRLNAYGRIVAEEWRRSADIRQEIELDAFVVMPNHVHGIVIIHDGPVGADGRPPLPPLAPPKRSKLPLRQPRSLGAFVAGFKSSATRRINELRGTRGLPVWQRNYYDHIVRSESALQHLRAYVENNPLQWAADAENPAAPR